MAVAWLLQDGPKEGEGPAFFQPISCTITKEIKFPYTSERLTAIQSFQNLRDVMFKISHNM